MFQWDQPGTHPAVHGGQERADGGAEAHPLLHLNGRGLNVLVQKGPSLNPMWKGNPGPSGVALSLSLRCSAG